MSESPSKENVAAALALPALGAAMLMLIAGVTFWQAKLARNAVLLIVYWMTCLVLTALAAAAAIVDAARVRLENREEQRTLLEETLREVERDKKSRRGGKH